jgi:hypothetical protein
MDARTHIKAALREAASGALTALPARGPCAGCGAESAEAYVFGFARTSRTESLPGPTGTTITTFYDSVGARAVHLCRQCIEPTRRRRAARPLWVAVGIDLALLVAGFLAVRTRGWDFALPVALSAALLTFIILLQRKRVLGNIQIPGQARALELHEAELRRQGYDAFWCDPEDF